jgi:membrane-bound lytic murein transglycosylase D
VKKDCIRNLAGWLGGITLAACQAPLLEPEGAPEPVAAIPQESTLIVLKTSLTGAQEALHLAGTTDYAKSPFVPPKPDLWRDLRNNMHLELYLEQSRVQQEIRWLQRHPEYFKRLQPRLQAYLPYLYTQTQLKSMPAELALLPIIESALDTFAFSHGGAAGPWQFVRGTARQYGLDINDWYDGRRDVIASTDAALQYLTDLHKRFDDWNLALAGYNAGQGNVSRALRRRPGGNFFELRLPKETQAYVPRLLALAAVVKDPNAFGITLPEVVPLTTFRTLETHSQFQLTKLSSAIGIDIEEIYRWNPALNQWATPPRGPHRIIVPAIVDIAAAQAEIDAIPSKQRVDWTEINVQEGDTLSQIARRHGTDVTSLRLANNLSNSRIRAGKKLLIPTHAEALKTTPRSASGNLAYVVQPGDSLWTIARAHKVKLNKLMRNNHLGPKDTLSVGKTLKIPGTTAVTRKVTRKVHYKVRKGDSLARIAGKFNVSINQIANWNKLDAKRYLQPGQGLLLYVNVLGG